MKQLYIIKECISSSNNGIGTYINQLIFCLSGFDISINILCFNSDRKIFSVEKIKDVTYYFFPPFADRCINSNSLIINKFIRLYIADSPNNFFLFNYTPGALFMKTIQVSHPLSSKIYVVHDMGWTTYLFGNVEKYVWILKHRNEKRILEQYATILDSFQEEVEMCKYADRIISLSEDTYNLLANHYPIQNDKLFLIPNALMQDYKTCSKANKMRLKKKMFLRDDEKIILYVGRMVEQKGIFVYIEAFKEIVKRDPLCRLVIVGGLSNFHYVIKKCYPVLTHIHFTGVISSTELKRWYRIADIGVMPSYTEQCSFVGLEMIAHDLPIVASNGFGIRCMFNEGNAKIAKIGKYNSIKKYKKELVDSTLEILCFIHNNQKKATSSKKLNYKKYSMENVISLYRNCLQI